MGQFSTGEFSSGEFSPGEFTVGEFDEGEFSVGEFYEGEFSAGEFYEGEFSVGEFSLGEFSRHLLVLSSKIKLSYNYTYLKNFCSWLFYDNVFYAHTFLYKWGFFWKTEITSESMFLHNTVEVL